MESTDTHIPQEAAFYHRRWLSAYDLIVLGLVSRWVWRCSRRTMLAHYDRQVGARHLDIGPGTGWYLDHCRFPADSPSITLLDANDAALSTAAGRIERYRPATRVRDALQPFDLGAARFDSVGMSFLLHCLPGPMAHKAAVLDHVTPYLVPGARVFGSTVLGVDAPHTTRSGRLLRRLNRSGVFSNFDDRAEDLAAQLAARFTDVEVTVTGVVCLFSARFPGSR
ncbi:class I SAM-dependent methyltransferase [Actinoplanes sp. NPDC026619]|uniref:class I SAM-dependent methyltransferase n=1 Tax=Actinoplanes sp. NPDC026619 TaxID=3155798 RepID=UPI0033FEB07E